MFNKKTIFGRPKVSKTIKTWSDFEDVSKILLSNPLKMDADPNTFLEDKTWIFNFPDMTRQNLILIFSVLTKVELYRLTIKLDCNENLDEGDIADICNEFLPRMNLNCLEIKVPKNLIFSWEDYEKIWASCGRKLFKLRFGKGFEFIVTNKSPIFRLKQDCCISEQNIIELARFVNEDFFLHLYNIGETKTFFNLFSKNLNFEAINSLNLAIEFSPFSNEEIDLFNKFINVQKLDIEIYFNFKEDYKEDNKFEYFGVFFEQVSLPNIRILIWRSEYLANSFLEKYIKKFTKVVDLKLIHISRHNYWDAEFYFSYFNNQNLEKLLILKNQLISLELEDLQIEPGLKKKIVKDFKFLTKFRYNKISGKGFTSNKYVESRLRLIFVVYALEGKLRKKATYRKEIVEEIISHFFIHGKLSKKKVNETNSSPFFDYDGARRHYVVEQKLKNFKEEFANTNEELVEEVKETEGHLEEDVWKSGRKQNCNIERRIQKKKKCRQSLKDSTQQNQRQMQKTRRRNRRAK